MSDIPALVAVSTCFRQIDADTTPQVLQRLHERSRWSRRFASSVESVIPAGGVEF